VREDQTEFDDRLVGALGNLDETARICLLLRTLESMSYRDISRVLAIPEGTAMSHVHRSRRTLREALAERGDRADDGGPRG
jgi:RNA polymerase sigma-70 factor (ECF subfamily)